MHEHQALGVLAGLVGFVVGGVVAETFTRIAELLVVAATLGAVLGGAVGAHRELDITATAARGGAFGLVFGAGLAVVDAFIGA